MTTRRQFLAAAGAAAPAFLASNSSAAPAAAYPRMGGTPTAFALRSRGSGGGRGRGQAGGGPAGRPPAQAGRGQGGFDIVEHCHNIGLGGVQIGMLPLNDPEAMKKVRAKLEEYKFHMTCDLRLPTDQNGVEAYEAQVKAAKEAGALAFHAAMTGRRYEDFSDFATWKAMFERCQKQVELAEPVLRKYKMKLAVENHKGWRASEQVAWLKRLGSEWVGVCLDFGNNISLTEDPMDTCKMLAPYTVFAHIKDMAVEEYEDGFLLSEVPMGEGFLDLKEMVRILRQKDPQMIFDLEMITRDPLKIPVLTPKYWATFDNSYNPVYASELSKVMAMVKKNKPRKPLPKTSGLAPEAQLKLEDDLNNQCIAWAKQNLDM